MFLLQPTQNIHAQTTVQKAACDSCEYVEKIYRIPFEEKFNFKRVKGKLNGLPLTVIYTTQKTPVTVSAFYVKYLLDNGFIKKSDIRINGKALEGEVVSVGASVILRKISFGDFIRYGIKAKVVDNNSQAISVGPGFWRGEIVIENNHICVTIKEKVKQITSK